MSWWTRRRDRIFNDISDVLGIHGEHVITVGHTTYPSLPLGKETSLNSPLTVFNTIKMYSGKSISTQVREDILKGKTRLSKDLYRKSLDNPQFRNTLSSYVTDTYTDPLQTYLSNQYADYMYHYTGTEFTLESPQGLDFIALIGTYDSTYWYVVYEDYGGILYVKIPITDTTSTLGILYTENRLDEIHTQQSDIEILNREYTYPSIPIKLDGSMIKGSAKGTKEHTIYTTSKDILGRRIYNSIANQFTDTNNDEDNSMAETLANSDDIFINFGLNIERDVPLINKAIFYTIEKLYRDYRTSAITDRIGKINSSIIQEQLMSSTNEAISRISAVHQMDIEYVHIGNGTPLDYSNPTFVRKIGYYDKSDNIYYVDKIADIRTKLITVIDEVYGDTIYLPVDDYFLEYSIVYPNHTQSYRVSSLKTIQNVQKGDKSHSSTYSVADIAFGTQTKGSICLPFFEEAILSKMGFSERYNLIDLSMHMVVLYYKDTYIHWYETGAFGTIVQITLYAVAIAFEISTLGAGTPISVAIIAVAETIIISVAISYAIKWVFQHTDNAFLRVIAVVALVVVGMYAGNVDFSNLSTLDTALHIVNAVNTYINTTVDVDMVKILEDNADMHKQYTEYMEYINELNTQQGFNESDSSLIVDIVAKYTPIESPNEFYARILMSTSPIELTEKAIEASLDVNLLTRI